MQRLNLVGSRFGRLIVLKDLGNDNNGKPSWLCKCDCGNELTTGTLVLRSGKKKSCGCLRREKSRDRAIARTKHGHYSGNRPTPEWTAWASMRQRCLRPSHPQYSSYGGRGIKICERWMLFENFLADMGTKPAAPPGMKRAFSLDRIDNERGYEPDNCRWATSTTQNNNTRGNHRITIHGSTQTLSQWAKELGVTRSQIRRLSERLGGVEAAILSLWRPASG